MAGLSRSGLISAAALQARLVDPGARNVQVFHVGFGAADCERFQRQRISSAHFVDTGDFETEESLWNVLPYDQLVRYLSARDIDGSTDAVVYDASNSLAAARFGHVLLWAGVRSVQLLDGGLAAWRAAGLPVISGADVSSSSNLFSEPLCPRPGLLTTHGEVQRIVAAQALAPVIDSCVGRGLHGGVVDSGAQHIAAMPEAAEPVRLVSVRSRPEFDGVTSGYAAMTRLGDIPGALWAGAGPDAYTLREWHTAEGTFVGREALAALWTARGIVDAALFATPSCAREHATIPDTTESDPAGCDRAACAPASGSCADGVTGSGSAAMPPPPPFSAAADHCAASPAAVAPVRLIFYCGTGWRASLAFWYALELGFGDCASVYDGGWWEWSADPGNPIVVRKPAATGPLHASTAAHAAAAGSPTCRDPALAKLEGAGSDLASAGCVVAPTAISCRMRASSG